MMRTILRIVDSVMTMTCYILLFLSFLDEISISGNSDARGLVTRQDTANTVKHHVKQIKPPAAKAYSVYRGIIN